MGRSVRVLVASGSDAKVGAAAAVFGDIADAFRDSGLDCDVDVAGVPSIESGVSAQPVGDDETRAGARNRLRGLTERRRDGDFYVSFEGGVVEEGGRFSCFAWVCVGARGSDFVSEVRSASHPLPEGIEALIRDGVELGIATNRFYTELKPGYGKASGGTIGALTGGWVTRVGYYAHPLTLALVPFLNAADWGLPAGSLASFPPAPAPPPAAQLLAAPRRQLARLARRLCDGSRELLDKCDDMDRSELAVWVAAQGYRAECVASGGWVDDRPAGACGIGEVLARAGDKAAAATLFRAADEGRKGYVTAEAADKMLG